MGFPWRTVRWHSSVESPIDTKNNKGLATRTLYSMFNPDKLVVRVATCKSSSHPKAQLPSRRRFAFLPTSMVYAARSAACADRNTLTHLVHVAVARACDQARCTSLIIERSRRTALAMKSAVSAPRCHSARSCAALSTISAKSPVDVRNRCSVSSSPTIATNHGFSGGRLLRHKRSRWSKLDQLRGVGRTRDLLATRHARQQLLDEAQSFERTINKIAALLERGHGRRFVTA